MLAIQTIFPLRDAYVSQFYPNQNFGNSAFLYISQYQQVGDDYRSLLQFSLASIPPRRRIVSARLQLRVYRNEIPSGSRIQASLRRNLRSWRESTVTWNNQPASNQLFRFSISSAQRPGSIINLNLTSLVRRWYRRQIPNFGIAIRGNEARNSLVGFYSSESSRAPRLIINHVRI
jgi:hypothetical protein